MFIVGAGGYFGYHLAKLDSEAICVDTDFDLHTMPLMKTNVIVKKRFEELLLYRDDVVVAPMLGNSYDINRPSSANTAAGEFSVIEKVVRHADKPVLLSSHRAEGDNLYGWWLRTLERFALYVGSLWGKDVLIIRLHNFYGDDEWERDGYISVVKKIEMYKDKCMAFPVYIRGDKVGKRYFMNVDDAAKAVMDLIEDEKGIVELHGEELVEIDEFAEDSGLDVRYVEDKVWNRIIEPRVVYKEYIV